MLNSIFSWTEANTGILRQMAQGGSTASEVSSRIGCSRSAVLGKAMRLGISFKSGVKGGPKAKVKRDAPKQVQAKRTVWTEERITQAVECWSRGDTAQMVADAVGCSLNAFLDIQRRYRDRFPRRETTSIRAVLDALPVREQRLVADSVPFLLPEFPSIRFAHLEPQHCRWPVSNDHGADMLCCGAQRLKGSYCGVHAVVARGRGTEGERKAVSVGRNW